MSEFRLATAGHAQAMAAIHAAAFQPADSWSADVFRLQLELSGAFGLIDSDRGFVLARSTGEEAEILTLAVSPGARRQGVGTGLLVAAQAIAANGGAGAMFLEVSTGNDAALGLYGKLGFLPVGRRRAYYSSGEDALVLKASLGS